MKSIDLTALLELPKKKKLKLPDVDAMPCEELEAELVKHLSTGAVDIESYFRALHVAHELKSRRLAAGAG